MLSTVACQEKGLLDWFMVSGWCCVIGWVWGRLG